MTCPNCGAEIEEEQRFCFICGYNPEQVKELRQSEKQYDENKEKYLIFKQKT